MHIIGYRRLVSMCSDGNAVPNRTEMSSLYRTKMQVMRCMNYLSETRILITLEDGLSAGAILRHTLILLGLSKERIHVHLLSKGTNIHSEDERQKMASCSPAFVFVVDQGSRSGPSIIDSPHTGLIIDHHHATEQDFPAGSEHVSCAVP